jgi:demethylmenaquinone methyltransferase/2-methoxy-6-polyprenyl-1,4-benzoquinol methylase/phosphoethanolamine N-methyltransferase
MHRLHNKPRIKNAPQTTGTTIHWGSQYDILSGLLGLGSNGPNSRMVIELANLKPGDRVLDVGCGTGGLTLTARSYTGPSGKVYGIDAAPEMIEVAKKKALRAGLEVVFDVGLIEELAFPDATFDVVISRLAIHHLPDDLKRRGFAEILRVLKPGGSLLIADFKPPTNPVLHHITSALIGNHMMQTNVWSIPPMLASAGYVEIASGPTRSTFLAFVSGRRPGLSA